MPSRRQLPIISNTRAASVDDINAIYHVLNGSYSNATQVSANNALRGHGMSVQLTGYDGRLTSPDGVLGSLDTTRYALEVRNRESTARRTAAFRDYDNTVVAEVRAGYLRAIDTASSVSTAAPVIVSGTVAGGVLTGTYPNPSFSAASLELLVKPTMIVAWYGAYTVTAVSDGGGGYNNEVTDAPGWVCCDGSFYGVNTNVRLRAGGTIVPPNMANTLPIGAGTIAHQGAGGAVSWASLATVSTAHTHTMTHEHTVPDHHHSLNNHTHETTVNFTHKHNMPDHTHGLNSHVHDIGNHYHTGNTLAWPHEHSHDHTTSAHLHNVPAHGHTIPAHLHNIRHDHTMVNNASFFGAAAGGSDVAAKDHSHDINTNNTDTDTDTDARKWSTTAVQDSARTTAMVDTDNKPDFNTDNNTAPANTGPRSTAVSTSSTWTGNTSTPTTSPSANVTGAPNATPTLVTEGSGTALTDTPSNPGSSIDATSGYPSETYTATDSTVGTINQNPNLTDGQSVSSINAQPPVRAWYWIMKL